ncbi:hypothetical protein Tco_1047149 [Tanacetum coccineum]
MNIRPQPPIAASTDALITAVAATLPLPSPPPSPLTSYSSPLPQIPSPPLPVSSPLPMSPPPLSASPTHPLGYIAIMIRLRAEHSMPSESSRTIHLYSYILAPRLETPPSGTPPLLPIPSPTSSLHLLLPSIDCRADVTEVTLPPQKRLCIAPGPRYEIGESSSTLIARPTRGLRVDYGFVGTLDAEIMRDFDREIGYEITNIWEDPDEIAEEIPAANVVELGQRMTDFVTTVRQDTDEIYGRLDNEQDDRSLMSGQLNLLRKDRRSHACTTILMESEARASREAWVQSMDATDHRRQAQLTEALTLLKILQTQMAALQSQQRPARDPTHPDVLEEAGSSS